MPKLFNAAKTGNIKELKRLKENGVDLGQSDEYGNTPLLWAACYGHLDVVIWLLKQGQSEVTKANKLGNTALLLAASYGQLEVVQWLLSEGQAKYTETNTLDMSPLSLAIISDQLAVVDYLVRNYYLRTNFNFDITSKNKAINYYLKLASLFSQNNVNYSEIHSLIDSASIKLKDNELNYLYCIYLWMDISNQADKPNNLEINTKAIYIDQLLPSLQIELISYMFQKGYVLNCQPINKDKPSPKGLLLNEEQKSAIEKILAQSKQDKYLRSIDSESEKLELYSNYYVIPLYRSITCALQIEDTIDKALLAPYSYHASSNQDPIIETNIAQWTAYHLCQTADVSEQHYVDVYVRTTGPSRLGYYEIIEKCLSDESPLKKSLLKKLGGIADFDGNRLHWVKNYPNWLQELSSKFSKQEPSDQTLKLELIGLDHPIQLKEEVSQILWDSIKHEPNPSVLPGNHPVYKLEEQGLYCKLYPSLPGINDALHYLYRRVFCAFTGFPLSVTGLLTIDNQTIPVLLSQDAGSSIEANDGRLNKLDPYTRSKLIVFNIITNLDDAKTDNHALQENELGLYDIYSVDNDQGFVNATTEKGLIFKTQHLSVKSFLFCLDAMKEPLDKKAVDELLFLKPIETLIAWLEDLIQLDEQYESLFKECKDSCANEKDLNRRSYLKMVLPVATLLRIAYKLQRLQILLKDKPDTSPLILLRELEPVVANYYEPYLEKPLSATERFDALVKEEGLYDWCKKTKSYSTTITSGRDVFEALVPDNQPELVRPRVALEIFKSIAKCWETLNQDQVHVINGEIARFIKLPIQEQQDLLKLTRLNQFNHLHATSLLEAIAKQTHFTEIYLNHPEATLTNYLFKSILVSNPNLLYLSVTNAKVLTSLNSINELQFLNKLRLCQLPEVEEFAAFLPNLTELTIRGNSKLTELKLYAPQLRRLRIIDCDNLYFLDLPRSVLLNDVAIQGCGNLDHSEFYCKWPKLISLLSEVPPLFTERLVNCINESFIYFMPELAGDVYNAVMSYLNRLKPLCERLDKIEKRDLGPTVALAYLGYDDTRVFWTLMYGASGFGEASIVAMLGDLGGLIQCVALMPLLLPLEMAKLIKPLQYTRMISDPYFELFDTQCTAIEALGVLQVKNEAVINRLLNLLKANNETFCILSARALINLDGDGLTHEVVKAFLFPLTLYGTTEVIRNTAIYLLLSMKIKPEVVIEFYLLAFNSEYYSCRTAAIEAVCTIKTKDLRITNGLIDRLKKVLEDASQSIDVHKAVNKALIGLQKKSEPVVEIRAEDSIWTIQEILTSLADANPANRQEAANAARMLQVNDTSVINSLLNALKDSYFGVRLAAAKALVVCIQQLEDYLKPKLQQLIRTAKIQVPNKSKADVPVCPVQKNDNNSIKPIIPEDKSVILPICDKQDENKENIDKKIEIKEISEILLAAEKGDLDTVKNLLSKKNGLTTYVTNPKNNSENTALSVAANAKHWDIVDYLIRYHYVGLEFNENEKRALNSFSKSNNVFRHYLEVFTMFSQSLVNYKAVASILNKAASQFKKDEIPIIYCLYLWMKVSHQANKPLSKIVPMEDEPSMNQLLPAHQTELIHHMIKEGYVLKDWSLNRKELVITDIIFDKKQANALEQLLEQSAYTISLKLPNTVIERDKIYFEINEQGFLQYCVQDRDDELKTGVIKDLEYKLTAPLTLDQLKSIPSLLKIISESNQNTRPEILTLSLNKVRFTKRYQLCSRKEPEPSEKCQSLDKAVSQTIKKNMLYVRTEKDGIEYTVITPSGKKVTDTISGDVLREKGLNCVLPRKSTTLKQILKPLLSSILEITTKRGHTIAEDATKGYESFLNLLKNQFFMSNLEALHLQDCDLYEAFDLEALNPIVAKRATLSLLNLDYNHITKPCILLDALFEAKEYKSNLEYLSLCFNKIDIHHSTEFKLLGLKTNSLHNLYLTGNMIYEDNQDIKINHKERLVVLSMLFRVLSKKEPNITVKSFLKATDIDLSRVAEEDYYLFRITLDGFRKIEVHLNYNEYSCFANLRRMVGEQYDRTPKPAHLFNYLISEIDPDRIPEPLNNTLLSLPFPTEFEKKERCKALLNYHQDAKLTGKLTTHSIFRSIKMDSQPSFLFPEVELTREKGWVYFIAQKNDKGIFGGAEVMGDEHSMLGFEYLTSCGQRIFKVAHLQVKVDKVKNPDNKPHIEFKNKDLNDLVAWTPMGRLIAKYCVDTKAIKLMDEDIQKDVEQGQLPEVTYEKIIPLSLQNEKIMNCLTFCLNKLLKLGIDINLNRTDYRPSAVVQSCIEANEAEAMELNAKI